MKRLITTLFITTILSIGVFATEFKDGICSGGFFAIEQDYGQGYGEWSFPLLKTNKDFILRDNLSVGGFGRTSNFSDRLTNGITGGVSIGNKLIFGGEITQDCYRVKSYGLTGVEYSLFAGQNHSFFSSTGMISYIFGGGFEFQYSEQNAFVIEFGGKQRFAIGKDRDQYKEYNTTNPVVMLGYRSYL